MILTVSEDSTQAELALDLGRMNLLDFRADEVLLDRVGRLAELPDLRTLVICSEHRDYFSCGNDVKEFPALMASGHIRDKIECELRAFQLIEDLPAIVIVALDGYALGGGLELALCGDIRIAAPTARLGLPEITLGLFPGSGGIRRLPALVGLSTARYLIATGKTITAEHALRIGLVDEVCETDVRGRARTIAQSIAGASQPAVEAITVGLGEAPSMSVSDWSRYNLDLIERAFASERGRAGIERFVTRGGRGSRRNGEASAPPEGRSSGRGPDESR